MEQHPARGLAMSYDILLCADALARLHSTFAASKRDFDYPAYRREGRVPRFVRLGPVQPHQKTWGLKALEFPVLVGLGRSERGAEALLGARLPCCGCCTR